MSSDLRGFVGVNGPTNPLGGGDLPGFPLKATYHGPDLRGLVSANAANGPLWKTNQQTLSSSQFGPGDHGSGVICMVPSSVNGAVMRTTDGGVTWVQVAVPGGNEQKTLCADGIGNWLLTCGNGGASSAYNFSRDHGLSWGNASAPTGDFWYASGYAVPYFFMAGYGQSTCYRIHRDALGSTAWQSSSLGTALQWRKFFGDGRGRLVALADNSATVYRSVDNGASWFAGDTTKDINGSAASGNPTGIAYGNGVLVVIRLGTNVINYSLDFGRSFSQVSLPVASTALLSVWFVNGVFVMTTNVSTTDVYLSVDGATWVIAVNKLPTSVTYMVGGGGFLTTGNATSGQTFRGQFV